jgi:hypothetical protein
MNRTLLRASSRGAVVVAGTTLFLALTAVPASAAAQDLCVSINGTVRVQTGTATCSSVAGPGNVAIARGANSTATAGFSAGDQHNRAVASGNNSVAFAGDYLSAAQSNREAARADEADPNNLLLHRMRIRRLEGEAMRDAVLAVSGTEARLVTPDAVTWTTRLPHFAQSDPAVLTDGGLVIQTEDPMCASW